MKAVKQSTKHKAAKRTQAKWSDDSKRSMGNDHAGFELGAHHSRKKARTKEKKSMGIPPQKT